MSRVSKALFGANIDPKIHNKLTARQKVAESSTGEFDSVQLVDLPDGTKQTFREALGTSNYDKEGMLLNELGSRTPWARMWTGVQVYETTGDVGSPGGVKVTYKEIDNPGTWWDVKGYEVDTIDATESSIDQRTIETKVYIVGSHNYNRFQENVNEGEAILRTELSTNPFQKDLAGITSIESKTEGPLGTVKRTTVNFIVHNFNDYQRIYAKYFLKPGAPVFLDFGWDTAEFRQGLYNPKDIIDSGQDFRTALFGDGKWVDMAAGDMEILSGKVVNFNSEVDEQGSFICSLEFISDNAAVLDYEIKDENKIRKTIIDNLGTILINTVANNLGYSFLTEDFDTDPDQVTETQNYANTFAQRMTTSGLVQGSPSPEAVKLGIFWKGLITENVKQHQDLDFINSYFWDSGAEVAVADDNSLYVSWGFFEEELLNKYIARGTFNKSETYGGFFNSGMSWISFDNDLYERQKVIDAYEKESDGLKFLYPPPDLLYNGTTELETYDTIHHKSKRNGKIDGVNNLNFKLSSEQFDEAYDLLGDAISGLTNPQNNTTSSVNKIRLRELFVNVKTIQEAMQSYETIQEAIIEVLNQINESSFGVFNLKLMSSSEVNDGVAVVDTNFWDSQNDETSDFTEGFFTFKPFEKGSIVKNVGLNFTTPDAGIANAIAVQNTPDEMAIGSIYLTATDRENDAIRKLYDFHSSNDNKSFKVRHLPKLTRNKSADVAQSLQANDKSTVIESVTDEINTDSVIDQYKFLSSQARTIQEGGTLKREIDKDGFAVEFDNADSKKMFEGLSDDKFYGKDKGITQKTNEYDTATNTYKDPPDKIHHNAIYAENLNELYMYQVNKNFSQKSVSPFIPAIGLTLTTYGISGLLPGDKIGVNYLPEQYLGRTFFTITNVQQKLESSGWETTLETQLRFRNKASGDGAGFSDRAASKEIYLHPNWFENKQISPHLNKHFKDFKPTKYSAPGVLVFEALGKKRGKFRPEKSFDSENIRKMFKKVSKKYVETNGTPPGMNNVFNIDVQESGTHSDITSLKGHKSKSGPSNYPYYIIVLLKGFIAVPKDDGWWVDTAGEYTPTDMSFAGGFGVGGGVAFAHSSDVKEAALIDDVFSRMNKSMSKLEQLVLAFSIVINSATSIFDIEEEYEQS